MHERTAGLEGRLAEEAARLPAGRVAVAVRDAATGISVDVRAGELFHAASTVKLAVMIEAFRQAEAGGFAMDEPLVVRDTFRSIVGGGVYRVGAEDDPLVREALGRSVAAGLLVERMITHSSNLAANLLLERLTPASVQRTVEALGARRMRVLRGVEDEAAYARGLNNTATAADLALLLEAIRTGRAASGAASRAMVDLLARQAFGEMIPAGLPPATRVAHKTGWTSAVEHDAAIVYPPGADPYVLVILTEGAGGPAGRALGATLARIVHEALRGV